MGYGYKIVCFQWIRVNCVIPKGVYFFPILLPKWRDFDSITQYTNE